MKNLAALTTFFITFLFVVYLGVFAGVKVNSFISDKKLVTITQSSSQVPVASVQPTSSPAPIKSAPKPLVNLAQASTKTQVKGAAIQALPVSSTSPSISIPTTVLQPIQSSVPVVNTSTPTPAPIVDTSTSPPVETPTPAPSVPPPTPPPADKCIIALSGGQYDVTDFRNIHSGGNVFACGTDMTAAFLARHPANYLQKMSPYKI